MSENKHKKQINNADDTAWHALDTDDVLKQVDVDAETGLNSEEVAKRREQYGENKLPRKEADPWYEIFARQFISPLMLLLVAATIVSFLLGEIVDGTVIAAALLVNVVIGFIQEFKVNRTLEQLQKLVTPNVQVIRDGTETQLPSTELIPGDIVLLSTGDRVVADARIIEAVDMEANEMALTGESLPVQKDTSSVEEDTTVGDRSGMVHAGTNIVAGRGRAVIVSTGLQTELGDIARLVSETEDTDTPLQTQLKRLARLITFVAVAVIIALTTIGFLTDQDPFVMFEMAVAVAVSAVPEGLAVTVTVILAIGMQRILKRKALVRKLVATETLGSVSIICADKTGTITEGKMRLNEVMFADGRTVKASKDHDDAMVNKLLLISALCNDASIKSDGEEVYGTPTERALVRGAMDISIDVEQARNEHNRVDEVPFSSEWKYMATLNDWEDDGRAVLIKGAPERVFAFADKIEIDGDVHSMDETEKKRLSELAEKMTNRGLRVLAVGYKTVDADLDTLDRDTDLKGIIFLGFVGIQDPLRKKAKQQIMDAKNAGIRTVIVTGDHPNTARAIAKEAGLVEGDYSLVTGKEMDDWSDAKLRENIKNIAIFARVEPKHKIRIVQAWKAHGEVVAMTGDGVNDAPALKAADIGVAVGSGTEVAKQAADMVLLNNDLGTITAAIEQGRVIFDNIRKTIVYLLADSFTELILIGGALLLGLPLPILAVQILWINLVADTFPAIAYSVEPKEPDTMERAPRDRNEPVLNKEMITIIILIGIITDIVLFGLFAWYLNTTGDVQAARTIVFAALGIDSLFYAFAVKSLRRNIFHINPFSNKWLLLGIFASFAMMLLVLLHPFLQEVFQVVPLSSFEWGLLFSAGFVKLAAIELGKNWFIFRKNHRYKTA